MNMSRPLTSSRPRATTHLASACAMLVALMALPGCATGPHALAADPYEATNRQIFSFNEGVDEFMLKPAAKAYDTLLPDPVQNAVDNFTNNIKDVWSLVNLILQGQGAGASYEFMRIGTNTILGVGGLVDVATDLRLDRRNEDLGQTLAVWGAPDGAYLVLPILGPSTTRDTVALPADQYMMPSALFQEPRDANATRVVQVLNARAKLLEASELLEQAALDKYAFVRDAYLQRRRNLIYNGEPPDLDTDTTDEVGMRTPARTLWTAQVAVPARLQVGARVERVQVDQSRFFVDATETLDPAQPADTWSTEVDLPTLSTVAEWQTVSNP